jgi:spermidine synthase
VARLKDVFDSVYSYAAYVPGFDTEWGFALCNGSLDMLSDEAVKQAASHQGVCRGLRFYDGESHKRLFNLPRYLRDAYLECNNDSKRE